MDKIEEAQQILRSLGFPKPQQNKICALTLLALANIKENNSWNSASGKSLTLTKGIINFVNANYSGSYKDREVFRNKALNEFIKYNLVVLNPDNPNLAPRSSNTHYALTEIGLATIIQFNTLTWDRAAENFKKYQYPASISETVLLRKVKIKNYKSIFEDEMDLGRVNVLVGANGSGKTNILEALAMVASSKAGDLDNDGLFNRGVRIAKPVLTFSSFLHSQQSERIEVELNFEDKKKTFLIRSEFLSLNKNDIYAKWIDNESPFRSNIEISETFLRSNLPEFERKLNDSPKLTLKEFISLFSEAFNSKSEEATVKYKYEKIIGDFLIYTLNTSVLRGLNTSSKKIPLGINGEGLDVLIASFNRKEIELMGKCSLFFDWLEKIRIDKEEKLKHEGHKLGKSISSLYFEDKFMQKKNNIFSAENANEGILHVLFYLALFVSNKTPKLFAIDNVETALNPRLCRRLIKELDQLAKNSGKQVIITTQNPAVLDGLNLNDDEQRLFEVFRNDEGMTKTRRIKFKPDLSDKKSKLSEMWMAGLIGGIPKSF